MLKVFAIVGTMIFSGATGCGLGYWYAKTNYFELGKIQGSISGQLEVIDKLKMAGVISACKSGAQLTYLFSAKDIAVSKFSLPSGETDFCVSD